MGSCMSNEHPGGADVLVRDLCKARVHEELGINNRAAENLIAS